MEAVLAAALIAVCAGAALAAVAAVMHAQAHAQPASSLTFTAQNILTDLRAATAYDPLQLATLAGRSAGFDADESEADGKQRHLHIVVSVTRLAANQPTVAHVTVSAANGTTVTIDGTLVQEAPAPGSVLSASTPPPSDPATTDDRQNQISL